MEAIAAAPEPGAAAQGPKDSLLYIYYPALGACVP